MSPNFQRENTLGMNVPMYYQPQNQEISMSISSNDMKNRFPLKD